ncbi:uncharacterized protein F5147DRAFT_681487 [Suillus discolor]|uniref:Uncharacterized protein n=1 Tax=Suillus discolor TaxID=1912936 RepID=A0A9P7JXI2_9AGAM|nr:uncharacterized protein F5147DRAFT_681487 [Suillus discolor]KAG2113531.1 hypothetical protein F5147DRAFT_681487 [Suillus discolor]
MGVERPARCAMRDVDVCSVMGISTKLMMQRLAKVEGNKGTQISSACEYVDISIVENILNICYDIYQAIPFGEDVHIKIVQVVLDVNDDIGQTAVSFGKNVHIKIVQIIGDSNDDVGQVLPLGEDIDICVVQNVLHIGDDINQAPITLGKDVDICVVQDVLHIGDDIYQRTITALNRGSESRRAKDSEGCEKSELHFELLTRGRVSSWRRWKREKDDGTTREEGDCFYTWRPGFADWGLL